METADESPPKALASRTAGESLWVPVFYIDLIGFALGFLPALALGFGIQAIGAVNGWWIGDSNSDDGEELFATVLGGLGSVVVLGGMIVALVHWARRRGIRPLRLVAINTVLFVAAYATLMISLF